MATINLDYNGKIIGRVQELTLMEVPSPFGKKFSVNISRAVLNNKILSNLFNDKIHILSQVKPLSIYIILDEEAFTDEQPDYINIFNGWFTSMTYTYSTDEWSVIESATMDVEGYQTSLQNISLPITFRYAQKLTQ